MSRCGTKLLVKLNSVNKSFPSGDTPQRVLRGVNLELGAGETVALTGESGSGKSTLLHIAAGLETADAGEVLIEGRDLSLLTDSQRAALRRGTIGVVFQQFNLVPSLSVAANIAFQARLSGREDKEYFNYLAEELGLIDQLEKYPETLSGGQQQRVAIARTLAAKPKIVFADEPTGNLDEATATVVLDQLIALAEESEAGLMVVTHSANNAARMKRRFHLAGGVLT
ncbi:MAG: ABC transporter ATP-binding protein [Pseudomonadota bacterium]